MAGEVLDWTNDIGEARFALWGSRFALEGSAKARKGRRGLGKGKEGVGGVGFSTIHKRLSPEPARKDAAQSAEER